MRRVAVVGSRSFNDPALMDKHLLPLVPLVVISGGARGADKLAEEWAERNGYNCEVIPADWQKYGRSAGFIRNPEIVKACSYLVAFWDGSSMGTKDTIKLALDAGKWVKVVRF